MEGTGWNLASGVENETFLRWTHAPGREKHAKVFRDTMEAMKRLNPGFSDEFLGQGWRWGELKEGEKVVDVGGSSGHTSLTLARTFPSLSFIIQDFLGAFEGAESALPAELKPRIQFNEHDFFKPQPQIPGEKVYLLRWILHDWPPEMCRQIIRNLTKGMETGSSLLVAEALMPPRGVLGKGEELYIAGEDIIMMALDNSQERAQKQYRELVEGADRRLRYVGCTKPEGSVQGPEQLHENTR